MPARELHSAWIGSSGGAGSCGLAAARFPYWSFTKTAIAIVALQLVEAGALELDARLAQRPYSLRQLLAHTSGLPDYGTLADYHRAVAAGEAPWPPEVMLERSLRGGMLFAPGAGWAYSNIGYMVVCDLIERTTALPLGTLFAERLGAPLGLESLELAETPAAFAGLHWREAAGYHPGWVYHRCLAGTAGDAARLLQGLFAGALLAPRTLEEMLAARPLGGPLPGRPWSRCGYALGLMSGEIGGLGRAIGHSGVGPFCVNAVCHFPDLREPLTVACFAEGPDEGVAEQAAARIAFAQARPRRRPGGAATTPVRSGRSRRRRRPRFRS